MENEIMNTEVIETEDEVTDIVVPDEETSVSLENENPALGSAVVIAVGAAAVIGVISVGNFVFKHAIKPIAGKIKKSMHKDKSIVTSVEDAVDTEFEDISDDAEEE